MNRRRLSKWDLGLLVVVVAAALALRVVWVRQAGANSAQAQWEDARVIAFAQNVARKGSFGGPVPFDAKEGTASAAVSPGYVWFLAAFYWGVDRVDGGNGEAWQEQRVRMLVAFVQAALGAVTAGLLFLLAYWVFDSRIVALLAGLIAAGHYFWVIGTSQMADGVLASFLLTGSLYLAIKTSRRGGWISAALLGLSLGTLALTRASLLLFVAVVLVWVIALLHEVPRPWRATATLLGAFAVVLGPWTWRNYQVFGTVVPITSRGGMDLWIGNHPEATGGPLARRETGKLQWADRAFAAMPEQEKLSKMSEPERFNTIGAQAVGWDKGWAWNNVGRCIKLRGSTAVFFATGQRLWLGARDIQSVESSDVAAGGLALAGDVGDSTEATLAALPGGAAARRDFPPRDLRSRWILALLGVGWVLGVWWSRRWRDDRQWLLFLALAAGSLPWLVSHAGLLHGPRVPLDGIVLVFCAFAAAAIIPGWYRWLMVSSGFRAG